MGQNDYEGNWTLADGEKLTLRHIAPADAAKEQAFVHGLSPESSYRRFHGTIEDLGNKELKEMQHGCSIAAFSDYIFAPSWSTILKILINIKINKCPRLRAISHALKLFGLLWRFPLNISGFEVS